MVSAGSVVSSDKIPREQDIEGEGTTGASCEDGNDHNECHKRDANPSITNN